MKIDLTIDIDRTPEDVFAYLTDPENLPEWQASALECRWEGARAAGARIHERRTFLGREVTSEVEVTAYEPDRRFALRSLAGPLPFEAVHVLEPRDGGTRLVFHGNAEPGRFFKLGGSMVRRAAERQFRTDFERLKGILEERA